nr:hypothetical protein [Mycoplasmopsis bovis]
MTKVSSKKRVNTNAKTEMAKIKLSKHWKAEVKSENSRKIKNL